MRDLINRLKQPSHDVDGKSIGPTALSLQAARAIEKLLAVTEGFIRENDTLTKQVLQLSEELENVKKNSTGTTFNSVNDNTGNGEGAIPPTDSQGADVPGKEHSPRSEG